MRSLPDTAQTFCKRFAVAHPIVQAPMAGGPTTPELVSAACEAGALGSFAAAILSPEKLLEGVAAIRARTTKPFAVNLFVLDEPDATAPGVQAAIERACALLAPIRRDLGLEERRIPARFCESPAAQMAALREAAPPVVSFHFNVLPRAEVQAFQKKGSLVIGSATNVAEARAWEDAGADAICAQGAEAGGHRGTFIGSFEESLIGTMALVPMIASAVRTPVLAAGGIMDGRGIAAALALGAAAAQIGTAFLSCPEAGIHASWKKQLLDPSRGATRVTRSFSGRAARGLVNRYIETMHPHEAELPPYPIMNALTGELRAAANKADRMEYVSMWAGQGAPLSRGLPAAELVRTLAKELAGALR